MVRTLLLVALLAVAAALGGALLAPAGARADKGDEAPASLAAFLPEGTELTPEQTAALETYAARAYCYCGCPHTLAGCLRQHTACRHAPRMLAMAARIAAQNAPPDAIREYLDGYYASFQPRKRARLDLKDFGPPLGAAEAQVPLVEFSDFTCPFCQAMRPVLEQFVQDHAGAVRLYYKPFPIASHPHAAEAAAAGEWARDHGLFWKMHDALFAPPHDLDEDELAARAAAVGGDSDDLRKALAEGRYAKRIAASQSEARLAGLHGTPTLFIDGRRLDLTTSVQDMPALLDATLVDELEWRGQGGHWAKD